MREADLPAVVEAVREPIRRFAREARARTALLISGSGQVVAQHGFTRSYEVVNVAALAAAANAAAQALARLTAARRWRFLHHTGKSQQLFLAPVEIETGDLILVAIFDDQSTVGLAQFFFDRLAQEIRALPVFASARPTQLATDFERDLEAGVERVFSPERMRED